MRLNKFTAVVTILFLLSAGWQGYRYVHAGENLTSVPSNYLIPSGTLITGFGYTDHQFEKHYVKSQGIIGKVGVIVKTEGYWILTFGLFILGCVLLLCCFLVVKLAKVLVL